ncbi:MAG: proprotein convertase P-domain-containing protein [Bacteroidales bacterium]|nr:proprotein convertase P-domain-containing protein [Bacteroidales bacterium]
MKKTILLIAFVLSFTVFGMSQNFIWYDTVCLNDHIDISLPFFVNGYEADQVITSEEIQFLNVCTNIEHSYLGDLYIYIICPNGQQSTIHEYYNCNNSYLGSPNHADNCIPGVGYDYCWTMNVPILMTDVCETGNTVQPGFYSPLQSFDSLIGCPINGTWYLRFFDYWGSDDGQIFSWGISFAENQFFYNLLSGRAYVDVNENAIFDDTDYPISNVLVKAGSNRPHDLTDDEGFYSIWVDTSNFNVSIAHVPQFYNGLYSYSPQDYSVYVPDNGDVDTISGLDFLFTPDFYCPILSVEAQHWFGGLCTQTSIQIRYRNDGTIASENTIITVELDDNITYESGGNLISQEGNLLTFDVGTLQPLSHGWFKIYGNYSCDPSLLGTTFCVEAHIYPDDYCGDVDPGWDRSSIAVKGECVGDSLICFTITNTGDLVVGDMQGYSDYRLYQDNILVEYETFQLDGGESIEMCFPATGITLRLEADQRPGHPGNSHPQESIEACGDPNNSQGQILAVSLDDEDPFIDIECVIVTSAWDPNDKTVIPQGLTELHFIDTTDILEYKIRFQNTGNAPAQKVVIVDTISQYLNLSTFVPLGSSHSCSIDFSGSNVVKWTFENINLPDSTSNEPESHGFVKFKIGQQPGNELFTEITNSAAIFFDYNIPVFTNEVFNIIGKTNTVVTYKPDINAKKQVEVFPNPAADYIMFRVDADKYDIELYDSYGRIILYINGIATSEYKMPTSSISNGVYNYRIKNQTGVIGTGKLVIVE